MGDARDTRPYSLTIRPRGRGWMTENLARRLADIIHGREAGEFEDDGGRRWVLSSGNNEFLYRGGEGIWRLDFRYGCDPSLAPALSVLVGPCEVARG